MIRTYVHMPNKAKYLSNTRWSLTFYAMYAKLQLLRDVTIVLLGSDIVALLSQTSARCIPAAFQLYFMVLIVVSKTTKGHSVVFLTTFFCIAVFIEMMVFALYSKTTKMTDFGTRHKTVICKTVIFKLLFYSYRKTLDGH